MGTVIVSLTLLVIVGFIVRSMIKRKKQAKKAGISGCGCNCPGCSGHCH